MAILHWKQGRLCGNYVILSDTFIKKDKQKIFFPINTHVLQVYLCRWHAFECMIKTDISVN